MLLVHLFACALPDDTAAPEATYYAPDAPGPWSAGTAESTMTGPAGEYAVQVWFPSSEAGGDPYAYDDFLLGSALENAAPDCGEARPVMVFSHGNAGLRYQSIFLTEHLATHGWVVVAPDHVGNTFFDDGDASLADLILRRPLDVSATFDWLADTDADGLLAGCVDPDDGYAAVGHSFGGYTTLAVAGATLDAAASAAWCADAAGDWLCGAFADGMAAAGATTLDRGDPRVWAAVPMAPAAYEVLVGGLANVAVPTLVLGGTLDTITPMATQVGPIYADLVATPRALGVLEGAGHFSFSDACAMVPTYDDCSPPYLPDAETHPVIATVTTAFLHATRGDAQAEAWLPDPGATFLTLEEAR